MSNVNDSWGDALLQPIVLDTNVASGIFKNQLPGSLATKIAKRQPMLTFVAWAELRTWTIVREWGAQRRGLLDQWMEAVPLVSGEKAVAETFGILDAGAQLRGRPKAENDMWIAACCLTHGLPLATLNVKDFDDFRVHHGLSIVTA
jgi:hypothetical protein